MGHTPTPERLKAFPEQEVVADPLPRLQPRRAWLGACCAEAGLNGTCSLASGPSCLAVAQTPHHQFPLTLADPTQDAPPELTCATVLFSLRLCFPAAGGKEESPDQMALGRQPAFMGVGA